MQIDRVPTEYTAWQAHLEQEKLERIQKLSSQRESFAVILLVILAMASGIAALGSTSGSEYAWVAGLTGALVGSAIGYAYLVKVRFDCEVAKYLCEK